MFATVVATGSSYPALDLYTFSDWAREAKLMDNNVTQTMIDLAFIATNYEEEEQQVNDDNSLLRYEFLEILLRLSKEKYMTDGRCTTMAQSFKKMIEEVILKYKGYSWQPFRDKELWTLEVNDTLEANLAGITKLYKLYCKKKDRGYHTVMRREKAIDLLLLDTADILKLNYKQAYACVSLCKMTVAGETQKHSQTELLLFAEFLEMIGRVADIKYHGLPQHKSLTLNERVQIVLDLLLPLVDEKRVQVDLGALEDTESDADY